MPCLAGRAIRSSARRRGTRASSAALSSAWCALSAGSRTAERATPRERNLRRVADTLLVRERLALGDRTFTVLAESWYDADADEWKGRFLFVPLDHSLPRSVSSGPAKRARRRDDLVRQLGEVSDSELARAFRSITLPLPRRPRER